MLSIFVVKDTLYTGLPLIYETVLTTMHKANLLYHQLIRACCSWTLGFCKLAKTLSMCQSQGAITVSGIIFLIHYN